MTKPDPRPQLRLSCIALATLLLVGSVACGGKSPEHERVQIPAVSNLREASETLVKQASQIEGPPSWLNQERDADGSIYGVGTARAKRDAAQDLFSAMQSGRDVVLAYLAEAGLESGAPLGFVGDLPQDPTRIQFEALAFDTQGRKWYTLAVLSKAEEAQEAKSRVEELDDQLDALKALTLDRRTSSDDRVSSALGLLFAVDERAQWLARYEFFSGETETLPEGLDDESLVRLARSVLSEHMVRVIIDGVEVPGLEAVVESALGDFYMNVSEFGSGLVTITLEENTTTSAGMELLVLDGMMQLTLDGESGRAFSRPLRAVTTYDNADAARARVARIVGEEVSKTTRDAIYGLARR
jgi:hypothetical protein